MTGPDIVGGPGTPARNASAKASSQGGGRRDGTDVAVLFGWVSLLQDLGSKMVVPVLPLFLAVELGVGAFAVGVVDGVGAVSAAVMALVAGRHASRAPLVLVRAGYGASSLMKLALAAATTWPAVAAIRVVDRAGKGARDAPRDLMLAGSPSSRHGRVFGVQQAMDKVGGAVGPLLGLAVFTIFDRSFTAVFVAAFVPCALSVALLWRVPTSVVERARTPADRASSERIARTTAQRRALVAVALHSIGFASISLLLLRALDVDASITAILIAYAALRAVTAVLSYPVGRWVDASTAATVATLGMIVSGAAVLTVAVAPSATLVVVGLLGVGAAEAMTKAPVKAWLVSLGPRETRGSVLGDRAAISGVGALVSSVVIGATWGTDGTIPLVAAGAMCLVAAVVSTLVPAPSPG